MDNNKLRNETTYENLDNSDNEESVAEIIQDYNLNEYEDIASALVDNTQSEEAIMPAMDVFSNTNNSVSSLSNAVPFDESGDEVDLMRLPGTFGPALFPDDPNHPAPLGDGDYSINSIVDRRAVMHLGGNQSSGSPIVAWNFQSVATQVWNFKYLKDKKAYRITNTYNASLSLSMMGENIMGERSDDVLRQYWVMDRRQKDGYYIIRSLYDKNKVLDLQRSQTSDGTPILAWNYSGDNNQQWEIRPFISQFFAKDKQYFIRSGRSRSKLVDLGAEYRLRSSDFDGSDSQRWIFEYNDSDQTYKIRSVSRTDMVVTNIDSKPVLAIDKNSANQKFGIEPTPMGFVIRTFGYPGSCLDSAGVGNPIIVYNYEVGNMNQIWFIEEDFYQILEDGIYNVRNATDGIRVISAPYGQDNLYGKPNEMTDKQQWEFTFSELHRAYRITPVFDRSLAAMYGGGTNDMVYLNTFQGYDPRQHWRLQVANDGHFFIRNLDNSDKVIDLTDENKIKGWHFHDGTNQKWNIERVDAPIIEDGEYRILTKLDSKWEWGIEANSDHKAAVIRRFSNRAESFWYFRYDEKMAAYTIRSHISQDYGLKFDGRIGQVLIHEINPDKKEYYWYVQYDIGALAYVIRSVSNSEFVLDIRDSNLADNQAIISYDQFLHNNQLWNIVSDNSHTPDVQRVIWASRGFGMKDVDITHLQYVIIPEQFMDESMHKDEIDLIFHQDDPIGKRLNMSDMEVETTTLGILGHENLASSYYQERGHLILKVIAVGHTEVILTTKSHNSEAWAKIFIVSPLYAVFFEKSSTETLNIIENDILMLDSDYKDSSGERALTMRLILDSITHEEPLDLTNYTVEISNPTILTGNHASEIRQKHGYLKLEIINYGHTIVKVRSPLGKLVWAKEIFIKYPTSGVHLHESHERFGSDGWHLSHFEDEDVPNMTLASGKNDNTSSITLNRFTRATLYENINYLGRSLELANNTNEEKHYNLAEHDFNNITSSYKVRVIGGVHLFESEEAFSNEGFTISYTTDVNRHNMNHHLGSNDRISSVTLSPLSRVELFEHANYAGRVLILTNTTNGKLHYNLAEPQYNFNNIVSSYRVRFFDRNAVLIGRVTTLLDGIVTIAEQGVNVRLMAGNTVVSTTTTNAEGEFLVENPTPSNILTIESPGHQVRTITLTNDMIRDDNFNISLVRREVNLTGQITDVFRTSISGVTVEIINQGHVVASAVTDNNGNYSITSTWRTSNVISARHRNFAQRGHLFTTSIGGINIQDIALQPINVREFSGQRLRVISELNRISAMDMSLNSPGVVHLWTRANVLQQQWDFRLDRATDSYTIINVHPNGARRFLAQIGGNTLSFTDTVTDESRWRVNQVGNGIFEIVNARNGNRINVLNSATANGTRIQTLQRNGTAAQQWRLEPVQVNVVTFSGQRLRIVSELNRTSVMDMPPSNPTMVHLWSGANVPQQQWDFRLDTNTNSYTITNTHPNATGRFLTQIGTNTLSFTTNVTNESRWRIFETGNGIFEIVNVSSGDRIDVLHSGTANGTRIQLYSRNDTRAQQWILERIAIIEGLLTGSLTSFNVRIINATVTLLSGNTVVRTARTDTNGNFSIGTVQIGQILRFEDPRHITTQITVTIAMIEQGNIDATMARRNATLTGIVTDRATGLVIAGAMVEIINNNAVVHTTQTDNEGRYTFVSHWRMNHIVRASHRDFNNVQATFTTTADTITTVNLAAVPINVGRFANQTLRVVTELRHSRAMTLQSEADTIQLMDSNTTSRQNWYFRLDNATNSYTISPFAPSALRFLAHTGANRLTIVNSINNYARWRIIEVATNRFEIVNVVNGRRIDLLDANINNRSTIQTWVRNGNRAQQWLFESVNDRQQHARTVRIISEINRSSVLDIRSNDIVLWTYNNESRQHWMLNLDTTTNTYTIINAADRVGAFLGQTANGSLVLTTTVNNSIRWLLHRFDDNVFEITNLASGNRIDVRNAATANGTIIQTFQRNGNAAQRFRFEDAVANEQGFHGRRLMMLPDLNRNLAADLTSQGNLLVWNRHGRNNQRWDFSLDRGTNTYTIRSVENGRFLARGATLTTQPNVTNAARWRIFVPRNNVANFFEIVNFLNNERLTVSTPVNNGNAITLNISNGQRNQHWVLSQ